ncbi:MULTISPECIES: polysaccharide deacetylase family protein [unclassified Luteimonas]|uniref:polysaccharide deacetylase family protein n=1 Tax=unclassified Luteimonas TaxID=2629088 RepID=UPI0018F1061A|nr:MULTISPECIES: polysaccharide deacetylase family protein [unclassified Luteimonas]MBJ6982872.1 polysaccharide deacetylase family protein [Luteimonas sp. MC1572]MBJ7574524.1 polysaccharide deacetylase family protein [Luteimonas sp. MC1828]QQO04099.1 polysaccharide deacetylase family protein [Luteimonas sp. MC1572]
MAAKVLATPGMRRLVAAALPHDGVLVLNYHRVGDSSRSRYDRGLWSATAEGFDAQVRFLKDNCDIIGLDDIADALRRPSGRYVAITFDDGYLDNHDIALPVLKHHRVPAAFFIATGFIDRNLLPWWDAIAMQVRESASGTLDLSPWIAGRIALGKDREAWIRRIIAAYKDLPFGQTLPFRARLTEETGLEPPDTVEGQWMDWDMVRALARAGMTIGGHTVNHPILSSLPVEEQRAEIEGCALRLREELGIDMTHFAYPVGGPTAFDDNTMRLLRDARVAQAFSFYGGVARASSAPLDLQRVPVSKETGQDLFRAMVQLPHMFCRQLAA